MIRSYRTEKARVPKRRKYELSHFKGINTQAAEEVLPLNYSPKSYNFCFGKGVLDPGYGAEKGYITTSEGRWEIKRRGINVKFLKFFHYTMHYLTQRLEKLVGYGNDGQLYDMTVNELYSGFAPLGDFGEVMDAVPYVYQGDDGLLISTATGLYFLREMTMVPLSSEEIFTSMCVHSDRVFAVLKQDEYKLCFSDDFDPKNWNVSLKEGGYFSFDTELGKIIKTLSYGGYVYLFFEHGIMRLTAYNMQTEFHLQKLYLSPGGIYKNTIVPCGDKIMFASSDGVFIFDGLTIKKTMEGVEDLLDKDQSAAIAVHHGGKYYLACRMNMDSLISGENNSLIVYDTWKQTLDVAHDLSVLSMVSLDIDEVRGVLTNLNYPSDFIGLITKCGAVDGAPTLKVWRSPVVTPGKDGDKKILREMCVRCSGSGVLKLVLDGTNCEYSLTEGLNKVRVMRPFDKLIVGFAFSTADARVTSATLTVDCYGE